MLSLPVRTVALRGVLYILLLAGLMQATLQIDVMHPGGPNLTETSLTEISQAAMLFLSAVLMLVIRQRLQVMRTTSLLLWAFFAASFVRENDSWLDIYAFDGAWQCLVALIVVPTLAISIIRHKAFASEFRLFSNSLGFGLFAGGFLTTYLFSRLYGRSEMWQALMGDGYLRVVKDAAEEMTELAGYSLLLFASVELCLLAVRLRRMGAARQPQATLHELVGSHEKAAVSTRNRRPAEKREHA